MIFSRSSPPPCLDFFILLTFLENFTSSIIDLKFNILLEWSSWTSCRSDCKRSRTRICTGGSKCEGSRNSEEFCQDGLCDPSNLSYIFIKYQNIIGLGHTPRLGTCFSLNALAKFMRSYKNPKAVS